MAAYNLFIKVNPVVLGCDVAGVVDAVGEGVADLEVGDVIWGFVNLGTSFGSFAEYSLLRREFIGRVPDGMSPAAASTLAVGALTAASALFPGLGVALPSQGGDAAKRSIVIWGAAGSVGAYAVQLAAAAGLDVIAVCSAKSAEVWIATRPACMHALTEHHSPAESQGARRARHRGLQVAHCGRGHQGGARGPAADAGL